MNILPCRENSLVEQALRLPIEETASESACPTILFYAGPVADCADHGKIKSQLSRRGGRAVDRAGLENRKAERPREFESHPLRLLRKTCNLHRLHNSYA
jgi:hypothetical protein